MTGQAAAAAVLRAVCRNPSHDAGAEGQEPVHVLVVAALGAVIEAAVLSKTLCLLAEHVAASPPPGLPARAIRFLDGVLRANQYKTSLYRAEAVALTAALTGAGIPVAVTGGLAVESTLYDGAGGRQFSDLDLLTTADNAAAAGAVLRDRGYRQAMQGAAWTREIGDVLVPRLVVDLATSTPHAQAAAVPALLHRRVRQEVPGHDHALPVLATADALELCLTRLGDHPRDGDPPWALYADAIRLHRATADPAALAIAASGTQARLGWDSVRRIWPDLPPPPAAPRSVQGTTGGHRVIVGFAGLPGTGKSTLAAELALRLDPVLLLDKDQVRHVLFGPEHTAYTRAQDDFCVETMFDTAAWQLRQIPATTVILDGRTHTRAYQVQRLRAFAARQRQRLLLVECVCDPQLAADRLRRDRSRAEHPARNRTPDLYDRLGAEADPIPPPTLRLDTSRPVRDNVDLILARLTSIPAADGEQEPS